MGCFYVERMYRRLLQGCILFRAFLALCPGGRSLHSRGQVGTGGESVSGVKKRGPRIELILDAKLEGGNLHQLLRFNSVNLLLTLYGFCTMRPGATAAIPSSNQCFRFRNSQCLQSSSVYLCTCKWRSRYSIFCPATEKYLLPLPHTYHLPPTIYHLSSDTTQTAKPAWSP